MSLEYDIPKWLRHFNIDAVRNGDEWQAPCPVHNDTDPSWSIMDKVGLWYCFGEARGGSIVDLTAELLDVNWKIAKHWLFEAGFCSESEIKGNEIEIQEISNLYIQPRFIPCGGIINRISYEWPKRPLDYLKSRGIWYDQIDDWRLGFAIDGRLANRIVIPIYDSRGQLVNYNARSFDGRDPRYLTPHPDENPDLSVLFGEHTWPKVDDRKDCCVILTEGGFNAMAIKRVCPGVRNFVGSLGGSPLTTYDPVDKLYKVSSAMLIALQKLTQFGKIYVATDPDKAGDKVRAAMSVLSRHQELGHIKYPPGQDALSMGRKELKQLLKDSGL